MRALIIPSDKEGPARVEELSGHLRTFQDLVGGWLEYVSLADEPGFMFVNEEGALRRLPVNERASMLAGRPIVGDVVVLGPRDNGDPTDVDDAVLARVGGF